MSLRLAVERSVTLGAAALAVLAAGYAADGRDPVRQDWLMQDAVRCRAIWAGGWCGLVEERGQFPALEGRDGRLVLAPKVSPAPEVDGRLDDAAWGAASRLFSPVRSAPGMPEPKASLLLCTAEGKLFVGATVPREWAEAPGLAVCTYGTSQLVLSGEGEVKAGEATVGQTRIEGDLLYVEAALAFESPEATAHGLKPDLFAWGAESPILASIAASPLSVTPSDWGVRWEAGGSLGFGHNTLRFTLTSSAPGAAQQPIACLAELRQFTRLRADQRKLLEAEATAGEPMELAFDVEGEGAALVSVTFQPPNAVSAIEADAAGAVDGAKTGEWGFHTEAEADPWWQVDLGQPEALARVVVYNRMDGGIAARMYPLLISTSPDGERWTLAYDNAGRPFGGATDGRPLVVDLSDVTARYVRAHLRGASYLHLDEVEVYAKAGPSRNIAFHKPATQSSVSQWSRKPPAYRDAVLFYVDPVEETVKRGERLTEDFAVMQVGASRRLALTGRGRPAGSPLRERAAALADRERKEGADPSARRELLLEARQAVRRLAFANPRLDFEQLLFVKRNTAQYPHMCDQFYSWHCREGGDLCVLSGPWRETGTDARPTRETEVQTLINGRLGPGRALSPDLSFDGRRVLFSYSNARSVEMPPGSEAPGPDWFRGRDKSYHIYELDLATGDVRQVTDSEWDDVEPCYLPSGRILFCSARSQTQTQCGGRWHAGAATYEMNADGSDIRRLTPNKEREWSPRVMNDGRILYTRWEYIDKPVCSIQSLWTMRPDGAWPEPYFAQHMRSPVAVMDARPIPDSERVVAVGSAHHGLTAGPIIVVDNRRGLDSPESILRVTPEVGMPEAEIPMASPTGYYSSPYPLSEKHFLASYSADPNPNAERGYGLYLIDVHGTKELIYRDPEISCWTPLPLKPRAVLPVLPEAVDRSKDHGVFVVTQVERGLYGVPPGTIRYLRLIEPMAQPLGPAVGTIMMNYCANDWYSRRILGTVPVEADGSAHFKAPINTAIALQALDENGLEVQRMRSFANVQPGEVRSCSGCHETWEAAPGSPTDSAPIALQRPPSEVTPPKWAPGPVVVNYLRDVQPVVDRHCVRCHSGLKPPKGLAFDGGLTALFNRSYETIWSQGLVAAYRGEFDLPGAEPAATPALYTKPLTYGSRSSKLIQTLMAGHQDVKLEGTDMARVVDWVDANAPYHSMYCTGGPEATVPTDPAQPPLSAIAAMQARRCASCHQGEVLVRSEWIDVRDPAKSLFLAAPLAHAAGGRGACGESVFADTSDADYQATLAVVKGIVADLWAHPRKDIQALIEAGERAPDG